MDRISSLLVPGFCLESQYSTSSCGAALRTPQQLHYIDMAAVLGATHWFRPFRRIEIRIRAFAKQVFDNPSMTCSGGGGEWSEPFFVTVIDIRSAFFDKKHDRAKLCCRIPVSS